MTGKVEMVDGDLGHPSTERKEVLRPTTDLVADWVWGVKIGSRITPDVPFPLLLEWWEGRWTGNRRREIVEQFLKKER